MRPSKAVTCLVVVAVLIPACFTLLLEAYLVISFAYQTVHIVGSAMDPELEDNDYLIADKVSYRLIPPRRGDIVIMRDPYDASRDVIKRVVGLPGEGVLVRDCRVYINRRQLVEPYVQRGWSRCDPGWPASGREGTLGPNEFLVLGDNRDHSTDSRTFGPVTRSMIEARASTRILPLDRAGPVDGPGAYFPPTP